MEVNKPEAAAPIKRDGKKLLKYFDSNSGDAQDPDEQQQHEQEEERRDNPDACLVDGSLNGDITPEMQRLLSNLANQLEPLKAELSRAQAREKQMYDSLEHHSYLPVLSRPGLEHELARVVGHIQGLGTAAFLCVSILNAEHIRQRYGRHAYEEAMIHACNCLREVVGSDDIIGCLGGHDLGVLKLAARYDVVNTLDHQLQTYLAQNPFMCPEGALAITASVGGMMLQNNDVFTKALDQADKDMARRVATANHQVVRSDA